LHSYLIEKLSGQVQKGWDLMNNKKNQTCFQENLSTHFQCLYFCL